MILASILNTLAPSLLKLGQMTSKGGLNA
ncbi:hypothetical protein [Anaerococcus sp. Marseille-P3915]|nr:hypothetical protein [Anaerococcus sp. Marseille-P3915]